MHEHLVTALRDGADYQAEFVPFSLTQVHIEEGEPSAFDDPSKYHELLAVMTGIVIKERFPDKFLDAHLALFAARHDQALDITDRDVLADVITELGIDAKKVFAEIDDGWPKETFRQAHFTSVEHLKVFGVPTFILDGKAAFVRVMHRPKGDARIARATIDRILENLVGFPELNELKYTTIPR
jgi:hypothetical protein